MRESSELYGQNEFQLMTQSQVVQNTSTFSKKRQSYLQHNQNNNIIIDNDLTETDAPLRMPKYQSHVANIDNSFDNQCN